MKQSFSIRRFLAILRKEWIQMRRDPTTLRLVIAMPLMQLFLFGYAINTNPKNLPTGILAADHSSYERTIVAALKNTGYYNVKTFSTEADSEAALARGDVLFVINIPPGFARAVDRGERPSVLIDADATDPTAIGDATAALSGLGTILNRDLPPNAAGGYSGPPFQFTVHARYNPEQITALNIVPGLICTILTFSTLVITTLSITRERERGTMENLLVTPARPLEVMAAKIAPYIGIGYAQVVIILAISSIAFGLPIRGSLWVLTLCLGAFIASNLALGFTFSSISSNQMQSMQMAQMTLLPSMLLSGFMFPFAGMPGWAQTLGDLLPMTHIMRIVRSLLLKGTGGADVIFEIWPILVFTLVITALAIWSYRETLD